MGPKFNDKCSYKKEAKGDETRRGAGSVTTETDTGIEQPQAKECLISCGGADVWEGSCFIIFVFSWGNFGGLFVLFTCFFFSFLNVINRRIPEKANTISVGSSESC